MQKLNKFVLQLLLGGCVAATLAACGTNPSHVDANGKSSDPVFPAIEDASRTEGSYVNVQNLRKVVPGLTKPQLYELIGLPHFSEAMFNVREWDYIFKFPQPGTQDPMVCQYKVMFDDNKVAQSYLFLPQSCAQVLNIKAEQSAAAPVVQKPRITNVSLQSDSAFDFGQATMKQQAHSDLERLTRQLEGKTVDQVEVIGHTDRIGAPQANLALSRQRARVVSDFLIAQGVNPGVIQAQGVGAEYPVMVCEEKMSRADLIQCLSPNRRVEVRVTAF
jgi:OOP family OmpA-OmpF porin